VFMKETFYRILKREVKRFGEELGRVRAQDVAESKNLIPFVREKKYQRCWKIQKVRL